ncbi:MULTISPECIES: DUF1344 domain-containing protein [unclassified Rhizobium]|uniref:DUF1344 domain-containing protein n=1 Tax=unclassified Rhizobium TaxID=2613769 RepID=UPI000EA9E752|nr:MULTISPECIES: DUF1344 domain-containing protein [unclassified Rhizobium]AYG69707.1 DUF1344 domain-containing protein [Rhizobium sp. CCGE531]AYG76082.1 DUF1344 domain-containing protein [Rhizobium sp. CCGE532]
MLKKSLAVAVIAASTLTAGMALARDETGTITNIDVKADQITLSTGTTIKLPENIEAESFKVGEKVAVRYAVQKSGVPRASKVTPAK